MSDVAVYLAPGISPAERTELNHAATVIKAQILQHPEVREAIKCLFVHYIESRKPELLDRKFELSAERVMRENDYLRGLLRGVDDAADYVTNPERINNLMAVLSEKETR